MSTIARFFDRDVVIARYRTVSGKKKAFQSTATAEGHIQELDAEARQKIGIVTGRAWEGWFDIDCIMKEGDKITDSKTGKIYTVRETTKKDYGVNQHLQVLLTEFNE